MRDPNRISKFCVELTIFWINYLPDLRFAQVFEILSVYHPTKKKDFCFYWEETDWLEAMENYKNSHKMKG